MSFDDPALLAEFVAESREHLADVEGQFLEIEAAGEKINVELVNTVFRAIHSIKGAAGFMGLNTINRLAHSLENVLGQMRTAELVPTSFIIDVMLRASDALAGLINDTDRSNDVDVSHHIVALDQIYKQGLLGQALESSSSSFDGIAVESEQDTPSAVDLSDNTVAEPAAPTAGHMQVSFAENEAPKRSIQPATPSESSIRVPVGVLDSLMNLAGELVLGRNQLLQTIGTEDYQGVQTVAARLDQVTSELQGAIMKTRMQPIGNVFSKFSRVVRDLSAKLGKQCDIVMEGKEVEVDKTIIEAIGDPLTHLVRNSVDHGVEKPSVRVAAGKNAVGTITLRAYHQAGKVRIDIVDDGGGIDARKLKQKAIDKGVITAEAAAEMTEREAVRLIFHPGFSTAEQVSDVSGRGVGMDVVRTNIEKIGGNVDVDSKVDSGTSIQITLPLTLAIIPSMLVRCQNERFAVPQVNVVELVRVRASEMTKRICTVNGAQVLRLRGSLLPLIDLEVALEIRAEGGAARLADEARHIIVVESGQSRYGLVVDEIDDSEEIVVKPLGRDLKSCSCLAGATILGDGHVAPILDVSGIAAHCQLRTTGESATERQEKEADSETDRQSFLLFSNRPDERFALPMGLIARIERVRAGEIACVGGQDLLQYSDSTITILSVEHLIEAQPRIPSDYVYVIVFNIHGRDIGLIAPELNDIKEVSIEIDGGTFRAPGVAGSMVVEERTIRLLDLYELVSIAHPEWFANSRTPNVNDEQKQRTILLAEDSTFFRNQVRQYLESEGFVVVDCEDGQDAWEILTSADQDVDMVVTDIEMPRLNGFELSRRIKDEPSLARLPIIALTSLASDEDRHRGMQAGIDEYQVKIDREKIMEAIWRLFNVRPKSVTSIHSDPAESQV